MSEQKSIAQMIPLAGITIAANVRTQTGLDKASIKELAESLKAHGLLQPIYVARTGDGSFAVIAGQRRTLAAIEAGWTEIPGIVSNDDMGEELKAKQIVENLHRENLSLAETCGGVRDMLAMIGKPAEVARRLNKSSAWVSKHLSITGPNFTAEVRELVNNGQCQDIELALTLHQIAKHPKGHALAEHLIPQVRNGLIGRAKVRAALETLKTVGADGDDDTDDAEEGDSGGDNASTSKKQTISVELSADLAAIYEALGGSTWLRKTLKKAAEAQQKLPL